MHMNDGDPETQGVTFEQEDEGLVVDLTNVEEMSFENIPKGIYPAVIDQCDYALSKNSGKPMWSLRFTITDGEYANRKQFAFVSFSEKALPGSKRQIKQFAPELLAGPFNAKKVADDGILIGRRVRLKVDIEKYKTDGGTMEDRNRVKDIMMGSEPASGFIAG